jgi:murein DD-endopeptidase MepM/ murein hydrolase activator NlpD
MTRKARRPPIRHLAAAGLLGFVLGTFVAASLGNVGERLRSGAPLTDPSGVGGALDEPTNAVVEVPAPTSGRTGVIPTSSPEAKDLVAQHLTVPVQGIDRGRLVRSFHDARTGGREHDALDILAPRNTPVVAVEDGTIAKLFLSKLGGTTIYEFDPNRQYVFYYAHLERYADGLKEGQAVSRGQIIGYVGTTGNAPKNAPHLHFAIYRLTPEKRWWEGTVIDPYDILR